MISLKRNKQIIHDIFNQNLRFKELTFKQKEKAFCKRILAFIHVILVNLRKDNRTKYQPAQESGTNYTVSDSFTTGDEMKKQVVGMGDYGNEKRIYK